MFYDHPDLDFVSGAIILPFGIHFWPPIHDIFKPGFAKGINNTFFLRRMSELMKTDQIAAKFPNLLKEARSTLEDLLIQNPSGVTRPPEVWKAVFRQNVRLLFSDQVVEDPKLSEIATTNVDTLLHTVSHYNVLFPWLPAPSYIKRRRARRALVNMVTDLLRQRSQPGSPRRDDPIQQLLDNGDDMANITEFFASVMFISTTNAHVIAGQMLNIMAIHPEWQDKIFAEIKAAADAHSRAKHAPLVDRLSTMPLEAWETSFPVLELCLKECIRMWTSFSVTRLNTSPNAIPIPGSNEVIPGNTFVIYNSTEVNFSEKLYPNPTKFDPERFLEGRQEYNQETYGCKQFTSPFPLFFYFIEERC